MVKVSDQKIGALRKMHAQYLLRRYVSAPAHVKNFLIVSMVLACYRRAHQLSIFHL